MDATTRTSTYEEGAIYRGTIIDQLLAKNTNSELQLILTVRVEERLKIARNVAEGAEPCRQSEQEVRITFAEDEDRLRMAVRDLERLGFTDEDVSRLDPEHPDPVSLLSKEVHTRMRVLGGGEYWNLVWLPSMLRGEELKSAAASLKSRIAAAKSKRKGGACKKDAGGSDASKDQPPATGGAK